MTPPTLPPMPAAVSAVLIIKDGEAHLDRVLAALAWCAEILVIDSGSTDRTLAICAAHGARVEHQDFLGYGPQKRHAVSRATHDWILSLDADEVLDAEAVAALRGLTLEDPTVAYRLRRRNHIGAVEIRHGVWSPDRCLRLFNRTRANVNANAIHEAVDHAGPVVDLPGSILHYSYVDAADVFGRMPSYARAKAAAAAARGRCPGGVVLTLRAIWAFCRSYVLKQGFRDGRLGVIVALSAAVDATLGLAMADTNHQPPTTNHP